MKRIKLSVLVFLCLTVLNTTALSATGDVYVIDVSEAIAPGIAEFIADGIIKSGEDGAACIVIRLDTPGGLVDSMRDIVKAIYASKVPVVVYVYPEGARAASAGVMILMAADVAVMSPGTNVGAAHPVGAGGKEVDNKTMNEKVTNDMAAYVKSIVEKHGRNAEWGEKAVRESVSITALEAKEKKVIDFIATGMDGLIEKLDGLEVKGHGKLDLKDAGIVNLRKNMRDKILGVISNPNIAYVLMMLGLAGLYFELSHPGAVVPGVVGGIAIILAFFAFQTLPVNYAGVLLIFLGLVFFIMEINITSFGLLSVAGVACLFLGSIMLFKGGSPDVKVSLSVILPTIALVSGFMIFVLGLALAAQKRRVVTGAQGLIGMIGVVKQTVTEKSGKIFIRGELWNAVASEEISLGEKVKILELNGLLLTVERTQ